MSTTVATRNIGKLLPHYRAIQQMTASMRETARVRGVALQSEAPKIAGMDPQSIYELNISMYRLVDELREGIVKVHEVAQRLIDEPGFGEWISPFLVHMDHDWAHLMDSFLAPFKIAMREMRYEGKTSPSTMDFMRFMFNRAPGYLPFCAYPFDLFEKITAQHLFIAPERQIVDLPKLVENCWLALAMRGRDITNWNLDEYSSGQAANPNFTGILHNIEGGLQIRSIEPYFYSVIYNLLKNAYKAMGLGKAVQSDSAKGFKIIVSARRHPEAPNTVIMEIIDNGPGFDLTTLLKKSRSFFAHENLAETARDILPENEIETLLKFCGSPYASHLQLTTLLNMVFLSRLSGFEAVAGMSSGLGLWGMAQLANQLHAQYLVGMNQPGQSPFGQGARFMLLFPENPDGWLPNTQLMARNVLVGSATVPWFQG